MANPYLSLFSHPGSLAFSAAAWVARMPISMTGIGIITMLSQTSGSYWLAGAVAATFTFSMALLAPQISRLVVLRPASGIAGRHRAQRDGDAGAVVLQLGAMAGVGLVRFRRPRRLHAQHVGDGARAPRFIAAHHNCTPRFRWNRYWMRFASSSARPLPLA